MISYSLCSAYQMLAGLHVAPYRASGVSGEIEENNLLADWEWRRALGFFLQVYIRCKNLTVA